MEVSFYQLKTSPLEKALPKLLEKAYESGFRVLVVADSNKIKALDDNLWTYSTNKFLPHGTEQAEKQPIFLSASTDNQNKAEVIAITNGAIPENMTSFNKLLDVFDGNSDDSLKAARERWKLYKSSDNSMRYWSQDDKGTWQEKL